MAQICTNNKRLLMLAAPLTADMDISTTKAVGKPAAQQRHNRPVETAMPHVPHQPRRMTYDKMYHISSKFANCNVA